MLTGNNTYFIHHILKSYPRC